MHILPDPENPQVIMGFVTLSANPVVYGIPSRLADKHLPLYLCACAERKGPKKLSDVKVNPQMSNLFANLVVAPAPQAVPLVAAPPAPSRPLMAVPKAAPASTGPAPDLLGDLDAPQPAAASFDMFASAPAPVVPTPAAAAVVDPFAGPSYGASSSAQSSGGGFDPFAVSSAAPSQPLPPQNPKAVSKPPLDFADFADTTFFTPTPAAPLPGACSGFDPFGGVQQQATFTHSTAKHDPFSSSSSAAVFSAPKVAATTTAGKDPFDFKLF